MRLNKPMLFLLVLIGAAALSVRLAAAPAGKAKLAKPAIVDAAVMDVNQIECYIQNNGKIGENPESGGDGFFYPKGQRNQSIIFTGGIWVLGKVNDDVRTACADYSTEFQPGMILPDGNPDDATKEEYKIYTYNKGETVDAAAIAQGCPPEVLGDKMMFCVYNDITDHTVVFTKPPIGLEVTLTAFGFNQTGALGNTLFYKFKFTNKGASTLDSTFVAVFFDPDDGNGNDDFVGCDTELGIGYVFNGDNYDDKYGKRVPSLGCDFFQGPIVDSPGSSAVLPDGTVLADKKILEMTSFFSYINGSPISGMSDPSLQDATGAQEAYYFVNGFRGNGEPWTHPVTGEETKFPFDGDPVLNTGWLMSSITAPKDMRMGLSAGPFTLAPNDPKEVVIGLVVGQGGDNMSSVSLMKYYDKQAQAAYDKNFNVPSPPPVPKVTVAQADENIMLYWDKASSVYSEQGYEFEGYNVYQGSSAAGPWVRVGTIDHNNLITTIWDDAYSEDIGTVLNMPVQFGSDTGLRYNFFVEKDYLNNTPLVNGRSYYFAVTGYGYNPEGVPKTLENQPAGFVAVPQKPVMDTEYRSAMNDTVAYVQGPGLPNDGYLVPMVVDPSKLTGHTYKVIFGTNDEGALVWNLRDETRGVNKLVNQTNLTGDEDYEVVDGLKVKVVSPDAGLFNYNVGTWVAYGPGYAGVTVSGSRYLTGVDAGGTTFFHGGFIGADFFGSTLSPFDYFDCRIDFWNRASNTADPAAFPWTKCSVYERPGYAFKGVGTFPGAAYDVSDPANPRRLNICFLELATSAAPDLHWDPIAADVGDGLGGREYLWIMASDYTEDPAAVYNDENPGFESDVNVALWTTQRAGHNSDEEFKATFHMTHPVKPGTEYTINTAGYNPNQSADVAKERLAQINVFPNPYFGHSDAEGGHFEQIVTFNNLPEKCTIRIFSLSGQLVRTLVHENRTPFERWDLQNEERLPVASGMFIVHIETAFGEKILKLGVINREQRYLHM